jgi:hypothetical protein
MVHDQLGLKLDSHPLVLKKPKDPSFQLRDRLRLQLGKASLRIFLQILNLEP